jgi:hypothetical protein
MSKSADVAKRLRDVRSYPYRRAEGPNSDYTRSANLPRPVTRLGPSRGALERSAVMNYVAIAVVIVLVSIAYEFTVMSWVIAAQEHIEDERARRY